MAKRINSRAKGAAAERELANWLSDKGYPARRGQQFSGSPDSPDVVCESLSKYQIECKRVERLNIYDAVEQAAKDAGTDQTPIVFHRKNKKAWLITMYAEDFISGLSND